ncbi:MAG: ATP synthase F1 subunit delta [Fibrobacteres bacterium]|jgi:F-type H+-transporting ATPase subunit delta|nr:ATP synthase F1 subunit delta [Fibrobacterota bacterium]
MKKEKAAIIYARTLLQAAEDEKVGDAVSADMHALDESFRRLPGMQKFLTNPVRRSEEKAKLLATLADKLAPLTKKFLKLLEIKNRLALLRPIATEYIALEEGKRNILRATVVSAKALAPDQIAKLAKGLEAKRPGKTYVLTNEIDPSLIAGFRIMQGDSVTDASIKNKLALLKQRLAA